MSAEWATFVSGVVGAVLGAGGAVATTLITTRSNRKQRDADRTEDRKDRDAEREAERVARLRDQGRGAARDALSITSQFFAHTRAPNEPYRALNSEERNDVRRIDDLAELIENVEARTAIRGAVAGLLGAATVEQAALEVEPESRFDSLPGYPLYYRERRLLKLIRRILGSYLREDADALNEARREAQGAEAAVEEAFRILEA